MASKTVVCVVGASNSAHATAGLVASLPGYSCHVFAPRKDRAELWAKGVEIHGGIEVAYPNNEDSKSITGKPDLISKYAKDVIPGAQIIIFCLPGMAFCEHARSIAPYVSPGASIGNICAVNGFDWCIDEAMKLADRDIDYTIFELQNLPWACRVASYGRKVEVLGQKPFMELVVRPESQFQTIRGHLDEILRVPCPPAGKGGFLSFGLSNICQIIHPAVMRGNFEGWDGLTPYDKPPLFYEGMTSDIAKVMDQTSNEILKIRDTISSKYDDIDLSVVIHIKPWCNRAYADYIEDDSTLVTCFSTNRAYTGLVCPMTELKGGGYVPNFQSRYLSEDVPCNLVAVKGIAELIGVETPMIDSTIMWAQKVLGKEYLKDGSVVGAKDLGETHAPQRFGFTSLEDIPEIRDIASMDMDQTERKIGSGKKGKKRKSYLGKLII